MDLENMIKLIQTVSDSDLTAFQYEEDGVSLKLKKERGETRIISTAAEAAPQLKGQAESAGESAGTSGKTDAEQKEDGKIVRSPLVGTFYTAPAQDAEPFVSVGDTVKKGQTLAIVEAMKLMNEIESEFDGVIEEILAENGQPVEYAQPLFKLK